MECPLYPMLRLEDPYRAKIPMQSIISIYNTSLEWIRPQNHALDFNHNTCIKWVKYCKYLYLPMLMDNAYLSFVLIVLFGLKAWEQVHWLDLYHFVSLQGMSIHLMTAILVSNRFKTIQHLMRINNYSHLLSLLIAAKYFSNRLRVHWIVKAE